MGFDSKVQRLSAEEERGDNSDKGMLMAFLATEAETGLQEHVGPAGAGETALEGHQPGGRQGVLSHHVATDSVGCLEGIIHYLLRIMRKIIINY